MLLRRCELSMDEQTRRAWARFVAIAVGVVVVGLAGYAGFVIFAESEPAVGLGLMLLAAATGFAAFFSPCSFPLMLTFLGRKASGSRRAALLSALRVGAGAAALLGLLGVVMASGGTAFASIVEFDSASGRAFRLAVGMALIVFGARQAHLFGFRMRWLDGVAGVAGRVLDPSRVADPARSDVVYGFGYLLAGFG